MSIWRGRTAVLPAVAAVAGLLLAACGEQQPVPVPVTPTPSASPSPTPVPATSLKPVLRGLLDRNGEPPSGYLGALAGWVVNVHWADIQPTPGAPLTTGNAIDQAIQAVRELNQADHTSLGLKIRIFTGIWAPQWAKDLGGGPVTVTNPQGGEVGTIGRFWTAAFGQAYDQLQSLLAQRYDDVPEVREVTIARCTTFYDEPFIRDTSSPSTVAALLAAGYTEAADQTCQQQEITANLVWKHTHSDLAFNPYQVIGPDGSVSVDETFTDSMMSLCRTVLGPACVLENNSLRFPVAGVYEVMYSNMAALGQPISFQTATEVRLGNLSSTLAYALSLGAESVELPGGYESVATAQNLASVGQQLAVSRSA